jgi:hypothetical protein
MSEAVVVAPTPGTDVQRQPGDRRSAVAVGLGAVVLWLLAGIPLGLLWAHLGPRVDVIAVAGDGELSAAAPLFSNDLVFGALALGFGVVLTAVVLLLLPARVGRLLPIVGLVVGAGLAGLVALRVGQHVRLAPLDAFLARARAQGLSAADARLVRHTVGFRLRARSLYLVAPAATALTARLVGLVQEARQRRTDQGAAPAGAVTAGPAPGGPWWRLGS